MQNIQKNPTLTIKDIKSFYTAKIEYNERNARIADEALTKLWEDRLKQRSIPSNGSRSGSCKFAALLARNLFGGKLAGNANHVFVVTKSGEIIDLNSNQQDVAILGKKAHTRFDTVLQHIEYREALTSCIERLKFYEEWVIQQVNLLNK